METGGGGHGGDQGCERACGVSEVCVCVFVRLCHVCGVCGVCGVWGVCGVVCVYGVCVAGGDYYNETGLTSGIKEGLHSVGCRVKGTGIWASYSG